MKLVVYQGEVCILSRIWQDHTELVGCETCDTYRTKPGEFFHLENQELPILPGNVPFLQRPKDFVSDLQRRRLEALQNAQKKRRALTKAHPGTNTHKGKSPKIDLVAELMRLAKGG